ncbi:MAG TPA: hypothetical protein PLW44_04475 [Chitinophagales bacterium]|nr:hypothetical protein [Chitinophagales bacterium]
MIHVLLVLLGLGPAPLKDYPAKDRHNDSLLIYNSYQAQLKVLLSVKETDAQLYYKYEAYVDSLTACAKMRLKNYNGEPYEPVDQYERPGLGIAHKYPCPGGTIIHEEPVLTEVIQQGRFVVYDKQTRFITQEGQSIPYVNRMVYEKGRLVATEKLNPVTLEKLLVSK